MGKFQRGIYQICGLLAAVWLAACGEKWSGIDAIKKKNEIVVYTDATWPPYEYLDRDGKIVGVDIDIAQAIAAELGVKLRVINADFAGFLPAVQDGQADMAIAAITITPERRASVDFSIPYSDTVQYIVKLADDSTINSFRDLAGKRIGVQSSATGDLVVSEQINSGVLKDSGAVALRFKALQDDAMQGLSRSDPAAIVCDEMLARNLVATNPAAICIPINSPAETIVDDEFYGVAVAKGNATLLAVINRVLLRMINAREISKSLIYHTGKTAPPPEK